LTSLTGGAWPLRRYWLKTKPVKAMKKRGFCHIALEYNEDDYDNNLKNQEWVHGIRQPFWRFAWRLTESGSR
jgi:hypothetical protein